MKIQLKFYRQVPYTTKFIFQEPVGNTYLAM